MGKFLNGLFVGIGIGLFIAPQKGEETRRLIMERVAALRKNMSSEDDQHILINARPPQIATMPLQPAEPIAMSPSEPEEQTIPSVPPIESIAVPSSEPEEQTIPSVPPIEPIATSSSEPEEQTIPSVPPIEPIAVPSSEPEEQISPSVPPIEPIATSSSEPTENRGKQPTLSSASNMTGRTAKRKASTRTSNTSKTRGHNRP